MAVGRTLGSRPRWRRPSRLLREWPAELELCRNPDSCRPPASKSAGPVCRRADRRRARPLADSCSGLVARLGRHPGSQRRRDSPTGMWPAARGGDRDLRQAADRPRCVGRLALELPGQPSVAEERPLVSLWAQRDPERTPRAFLHRPWAVNDADCVLLRAASRAGDPKPAGVPLCLSPAEVQSQLLGNSMLAGSLFVSDPRPLPPAERVEWPGRFLCLLPDGAWVVDRHPMNHPTTSVQSLAGPVGPWTLVPRVNWEDRVAGAK